MLLKLINQKKKKTLAPNLLYINNGDGTFSDFSSKFGIIKNNFSTSSSFGDINADGYPDLFVGNYFKNFYFEDSPFNTHNIALLNHYSINEEYETGDDQLFINVEGKYFKEVSDLLMDSGKGYGFGGVFTDFDNDNDLDLFVGERLISDSYGISGSGVLLINDGNGSFKDITIDSAPDLMDIGMITDAIFIDIDNDGDEDLIVVGEFMGINIFYNQNGSFILGSTNLSKFKGWWQTINYGDFNGDGLTDLVVGNHGLNSRFSASEEYPIRLYVNDFDGNDQLDPILTFKSKDGEVLSLWS